MGIFRRGKGDVGSILWYASKQKLEALETNSGIPVESLSGKLDVGPASLQMGLNRADPRIVNTVRKADHRLRQSGNVMSVREISMVSPPSALFEFEGPCSRVAAEGAFWVAGKSEGVAILLVGSLSNAVSGYRPDERSDKIMGSASADPLGAIIQLTAHLARVRIADRIQGRRIEYEDRSYMDQQPATAQLADLLRQRQKALAHEQGLAADLPREIHSEGLGQVDLHQRRLAPDVETIVIGSPIFVENVQTRTRAK